MDQEHVSVELLARWLSDTPLGEREPTLRHLVAGCAACRAAMETLDRLRAEADHPDPMVAVVEVPEASELYDRLLALPEAQRVRAVAQGELTGWVLCRRLIRESHRAAFRDGSEAVHLAYLAVRLAAGLSAAYDPAWVADLLARAWAHLGNARRVVGELSAADEAFLRAFEALASGTGSPGAEAEILGLRASLGLSRRLLAPALADADRALELFQEAEDLPSVSRVRLQRAKILEEDGRLEQACEELRTAAADIDPASERQLAAWAQANLVGCLSKLGRHEEAAALLPRAYELYEGIATPTDLLRMKWTEASIHLGLGRVGPAEERYREVARGFMERQMGYDAALVSLDLAVLYAREERWDEAQTVAAEILPAFAARDVQREAMAALIAFQEAVSKRTLTVRLLEHLAAMMRAARHACSHPLHQVGSLALGAAEPPPGRST